MNDLNETEMLIEYRKQFGLEDRADLSSMEALQEYFNKANQDLKTQQTIINQRALPELGIAPLTKMPKLNFKEDTKLAWQDGKLDNLDKDKLDVLLAKKQISNLKSEDFIKISKKYNVPLGMLLNIAQVDGVTDTKTGDEKISKKNLDKLGAVVKGKYLKNDLFDINSVSKAQKKPDEYMEKLSKNYQDLTDTLNG